MMNDAPRAGQAAAGPRATLISPTAEALPANVLRFYVAFSEPAEAAFERSHLRLLTATGTLVEDPFLVLSEELWSPDGRRLTILMEPGRIKRGMGSEALHPPALVPGMTYSLAVATGGETFAKSFVVLPPVLEPLHERRWRLARPAAGTRRRLAVTFDRVMDTAIVADEVDVRGPDGQRTPGVLQPTPDGRRLLFRPAAVWRDAEYQLVFSRRLEDICGNRLDEALDHLVTQRQRSRGGVLPFRPLPRAAPAPRGRRAVIGASTDVGQTPGNPSGPK
jgi:hypothetical protein